MGAATRRSKLGELLRHSSRLASVLALVASPAAASEWEKLSTALLQPVAVEAQLPNSSIPMALSSDSRGFLWVGTQNGLARWDGLQFRIVGAGDSPDTLPDSQIDALHRDRQGRLWIGTLSAGVASYDPRSGKFKRFPGKGRSHGYGVNALADAPGGRIWVGADDGLLSLDPTTGAVVPVPAPAPVLAALASGVNALTSDGGALWIGTNQGLLRRDPQTGSTVFVRLAKTAQPIVKALLLDRQGRLWVGTEGTGAFVVEPETRTVRAIPATLRAGLVGQGMRVRAILQIAPDAVWLGTYDDGVIAVDPRTLNGRRVRLGNGSLLYGDQNIRALYRSPDGQVFIAANSAITRYDPRHPAFETLMGGDVPTAVLAERTPVALARDVRGQIWTGYISHGLDIINPDLGSITHVAPGPSGLPVAPVRQLVPAGGGMLVGTDMGLYLTDTHGRHARRLPQPGRSNDAGVMAVLRDGERLWLGGRDGVRAYHVGSGGRLTPDFILPPGQLSDRRVQVLMLDPRGRLWIGTSRGLNVFDPVNRRLVSLEPRPRDPAIPTGFISSVTVDRRGRLWVATFGSGLFVADTPAAAEAHRFHHIDTTKGLPNANVDMVLEDALGVIWASTDSGLARIDPNTFSVQALQLAQGVPVASFFYNAGLRSGPDDLLFAGRGGLEVVHPSKFQTTRRAPPLRVTEVREHGRLLAGNPFQTLEPGAALRLPPGGGGLEIGFAALDYGAPERVQYAYRLLGASSVWTDVDVNLRRASLSNLAPGSYTLEVRASNPSAEWPPQILRLPLSVAPAWNQTWWFRLAELMAASGAVVLLVLWRTRYLDHRRRELEQVVEERTHALREQKEVLEAQATQLADARIRAESLAQAKSDFLANMSHEIRTPLNGVVAVADMLAHAELPDRERGMAEIIRASGDTLQRLLSDILDMARIESGKIAIETAPFHAGDMVRAVAGLSQLKCDEKGVKLQVEIRPEIDEVVIGDMVRVRQVITNLLSNAVKFTACGEVRLTAERLVDGRARFTVVDTGVGFAMADKGKVLGRFEQTDSSITRKFGGTGLGLSICCNLAELMGGVLDCHGELGVGARFWLELPLEPTLQSLEGDPEVETRGAGLEPQMLRLLIADDHPTNRQVIQLMLEGMAQLTCVEDGLQALEALEHGSFDVVLMDMQMPIMDGLSALRSMRRLEAERQAARTPAIMLTANAMPEHVASALAAGADLHLSKPFTAAELFGALEDVLSAQAPKELDAVA